MLVIILIVFSSFLIYLLFRLVAILENVANSLQSLVDTTKGAIILDSDENDEYYHQVLKLLIEKEAVSASYLQRKLNIGYARACRILDELEANGIVGHATGATPRKVLKHT